LPGHQNYGSLIVAAEPTHELTAGPYEPGFLRMNASTAPNVAPGCSSCGRCPAWLMTANWARGKALAPVASSADPVERVRYACEFLLRGVLAHQGAVRAMISGTITRPGLVPARPGIRLGLIDYALAPFGDGLDLSQLKRDLAVVVSAEALFTLTDLCGLSPDEAVASAARTAATLTAAAFRD